MNTNYALTGADGKNTYADDRLLLSVPGEAGLLKTQYAAPLAIGADADGLYKYASFLPAYERLSGSAAPVTYKSEKLAVKIGLTNLYVAFSGWWPERGAYMKTASFKETEAYSVLSRFPKDRGLTLVVASAGNTARAFLRAASENGIPLCVVVPEANRADVWTVSPLPECVRLLTCPGDYADAIAFADEIASRDGYAPEGGAKNVARRDGMGTVVLSAFECIGDLPAHYFQAVGSGTGGIAAHEAASRLARFGQVKNTRMKLHLVQNAPFTPMYDAWSAGARTLLPMSEAYARRAIAEVSGKVLTNRKPPYAAQGGVFDVLCQSGGEMHAVDNAQIARAQALFARLEGAEICPEAGAALAALIAQRETGRIDPEETVLLNVTGGGLARARAEARG